MCFYYCFVSFSWLFFFFSSRRRHTRCGRDWSSDVCSSDLSLLDPLLRAFDRAFVHTPQGYRWRRMKTRELEYDLPADLIAQHPVARRDESRLLVYERMSESVDHRRFAELPDVIGDALAVVNDTRVVPARIAIERPKGEVLLLERLDEDGLWEGLARP